jgi:hypothetical protein
MQIPTRARDRTCPACALGHLFFASPYQLYGDRWVSTIAGGRKQEVRGGPDVSEALGSWGGEGTCASNFARFFVAHWNSNVLLRRHRSVSREMFGRKKYQRGREIICTFFSLGGSKFCTLVQLFCTMVLKYVPGGNGSQRKGKGGKSGLFEFFETFPFFPIQGNTFSVVFYTAGRDRVPR